VLRYGTTRILDAGLNDIVNYIRTVGPGKFRYHLDIEIRNHRTLRTWTERLMSRPSLGRPEQMRMVSSDPAACRGDRAVNGFYCALAYAVSYWRRNARDFSLIKAIRGRQNRPATEGNEGISSTELSARPASGSGVGSLVRGGIPNTAATSWSIVASVCRGVGVNLTATTTEQAVPIVDVVHRQNDATDQELVLPGQTIPVTDTTIYARTNGYLKRWYFDIGAHVRQGQLLAQIETPELDAQLRQARADLDTAQANVRLAGITAQRTENLLKSQSVSTQERDNAAGASSADQAIVASRQAEVARLEEMQSYKNVYAPLTAMSPHATPMSAT
jgi:Biotin-lipoyl like